jgi:hypothetical protein
VKVEDPAGETWRIKRRWLPWRRKVRDVPDAPVDGLFVGGDDPLSAILAVVVGVLLLPVIIVFAVMLAEFLLLLLLLPLWLTVRALFGGTWPIEVWRGKTLVGTESVKGWGPSGIRMHDIAEGVRLGRPGTAFSFGESASS